MALYRQEMAARAERANRVDWRTTTLEALVTSPDLGGLPASAAQRALLQAADGRPVVHLSPEAIRYHFGTTRPLREYRVPRRPRVVIVRSGRRSGKSLLAAFAALLYSALTAELRRFAQDGEVCGPDGMIGVRPGELVRGVVVTPRKQQSRAAFRHLISSMKASKRLAKYLVKDGAESAVIRRDDGAEVTIEILAASVSGTNLRSSWFVGAIFDEGDFFNEKNAKIHLAEQIDAVRPALLAGGQIWVPSSPWEDSGPYHEMFSDAFGDIDNPDGWTTLAFHSDSFSMNPELQYGEKRLEIEQLRAKQPDFVAREYDAVPMAAGASGFFPEAAIVACFNRPQKNLPPAANVPHWAGTDMGISKNSAALALSRHRSGKTVVAYLEERVPTRDEPVKPGETSASFARTCLAYGATSLRGDGFYAATVREELEKIVNERGDTVTYDGFHASNENVMVAFTEFRRRMIEGLVEGPDDELIKQQLKDTKTAIGPGGKVKIVLPKHGNRHGDVLMSMVLSGVQVPLGLNEDGIDERRRAFKGSPRRW